MSFFKELKRRNVFRVAIAYALAAWVLLQVIDFILDAISAPNWILQVFILAAAAGFLAVLVFSWVFEMTPEGVKREKDIDRTQSITPQTGRKLDRVIIAFLAVAVVLLLADRFAGTEKGPDTFSSTDQTSPAVPAAENVENVSGPFSPPAPVEKSIAVLPFLALSSGPDDEYFADGLTEEILNSLAQLPELLVTARTSAFHFKGKDIPLREIATALGVRHIVEGSVRRSGERLRVTAQLIRAEDGFHLWSENYDSTSEDTIEVQEDIATKIAVSMDVVLDEQKRSAMEQAGLRDVEAFVAMQKGLHLFEQAHGADHMIELLREANGWFEIVQQRVPQYPGTYQLHADEYSHILMGQAMGQLPPETSAEQAAGAMAHLTADYQAAVANARSPAERGALELDLAFLSYQWQGMTARIERYAGESGCIDSAWIDNIAVPFGYAGKVLPRFTAQRQCDPLRGTKWNSEARALLWAGDAEAALAVAREGLAKAPHDWLRMTAVMALLSLQRFDEAAAEVPVGFQQVINAQAAGMLLAAARGDREEAAALFDGYESDPVAAKFWVLTYFAWTGDLDRANNMAASIDRHPFAGPALGTAALWCHCGAPWDIAVTPTFAARLQQSGLSWPPASPIRPPLKDW